VGHNSYPTLEVGDFLLQKVKSKYYSLIKYL